MSVVKCAYCFSTNVSAVDSYERRDVMVVLCADCGRTTQTDVENTDVDPDTAAPKDQPAGR
jgi:hypothetical protein